MHFWIWIALAGGFLVAEILTMSLLFLSFSIAALMGAIASALWVDSPAQWISFSVAALLTLLIIRPFMKKYLFRKSSDSRTGFDALIHLEGTTLTEITSSSGSIRLREENWSARSEAGVIPKASTVEVIRIDGAVAIVVPKISKVSS